MRWIRESQPDSHISRQFRKAMAITLIGNILLAGIKVLAYINSDSAAIYADAINSLTDVLYSVMLLIGFVFSLQPPDMGHPQGHSRFEPFMALVVTLSMLGAGVEAFRASIVRYMAGGTSIEIGVPLIALLISVLVKAVMFFMIRDISRKISSPGLKAAANDNLTDVVTSFAAILGIFGSNLISPLLDPLAGIVVALWIFRAVWNSAKENLGYLTGAGADEILRQRILDYVKEIDGIKNVHHIIADYAGPKLLVEMHVNVDGNITLNQAHVICDQAVAELEKIPQVDRAYVHIEPIGFS